MKALLAAVGIAAVALTTGCADSLPSAAASSNDAAQASVQTSLTEAVTAAKSYGQKHLGHYLELRAKSLRAEGFTPADGVNITVFVDHFDICVSATSDALPDDNEWSTATATSDKPEAVAGGRCSSDALRTFEISG